MYNNINGVMKYQPDNTAKILHHDSFPLCHKRFSFGSRATLTQRLCSKCYNAILIYYLLNRGI